MHSKRRLLYAIPGLIIALVLYRVLQNFLPADQISTVLNVGAGVLVAGVLVWVFVSGYRMNTALNRVRNPPASVGFSSVGLPQLWRQLSRLLPPDFVRPSVNGNGFYVSVTAKTLTVCADDDELTDLIELPTTDLYSIDPATATEATSGQFGAGRPAVQFSFLREENDSDVVLTIALLDGQDPDELLDRLRQLLTPVR